MVRRNDGGTPLSQKKELASATNGLGMENGTHDMDVTVIAVID
jgi:hypothetical protein